MTSALAGCCTPFFVCVYVCVCVGVFIVGVCSSERCTHRGAAPRSQHRLLGDHVGLGSGRRLYRVRPDGPVLQVSRGPQKPVALSQVSPAVSASLRLSPALRTPLLLLLLLLLLLFFFFFFLFFFFFFFFFLLTHTHTLSLCLSLYAFSST